MFLPPAERLLNQQLTAVEMPARLGTVGGILPEVAFRDNDLRPIRLP
jgi:hypothetical protein